MAELPTMSLKALQFNPVAFTPFQYEYKPTDFSVLERSLAQREQRMNEAAEAKGAIDVALAETELKLHENDKEWFRNYKENINKCFIYNINCIAISFHYTSPSLYAFVFLKLKIANGANTKKIKQAITDA